VNACRKEETLSCQQSSMSKNEEMNGYETICRVIIQYISIAWNMLYRAVQHFHQHTVYSDHGDECVNHMPNTLGIEHITFSRKMVAMTAMPPDSIAWKAAYGKLHVQPTMSLWGMLRCTDPCFTQSSHSPEVRNWKGTLNWPCSA